MFNWINKRFNPVETKSTVTTVPIAPGSFLEFALTGGGRVSAYQAMQFYRDNSSIATAVDWIAGSFEQIQPVLQIENGSFVNDHEVIKLLKRPNGFQTWQEFGGMLSRHYLLKHDSYIAALGNINRPPIEIHAVKPLNVSTVEDTRDGFPGFYIIPGGAGKGNYGRDDSIKKGARFYDGPLKELYHIMGFSSRSNNIEGDSPLEAAALEAKQQIDGRVHNLKMLRNGGRLSLLVSFKDDTRIDDDEHKERVKRINEGWAGPENAGKIAVVSGAEIDVKELGTTNKDMDYVKLDQAAAFAIYMRYNIPLPLVSVKASTFNNMRTAILLLYDIAILPLADIIFAGASKMLLPRHGLDPGKVRITYNPDSITALMERRLEELEKRKKINIETPNELRSFLPDREPVEGGDVLYQPANLVPVGDDLLTDDNQKTPEQQANELLERDGVGE